jgi:ABC-type multidrug transport system ATPase subunit
MKINAVSANHHIILGTTKINLFDDSDPVTKSYFNSQGSDLVIDVSTQDEANYYTYIIGENGSGKTLLFKTIINFVNNTNTEVHHASLDRIINLFSENAHYQGIKNKDDTRNQLHEAGIYSRSFKPDQANQQQDFLYHFDAQLIYISSAFDRSIVHRNDRFRSFNYLSGINQTKYLFFAALRRFDGTDAIQVLDNLLGLSQIAWKVTSRLKFRNVDKYAKGRNVELRDKDGLNIISLLDLLDKLEVDEHGALKEGDLTAEEKRLFLTIYKSGPFFKFLHNSSMNAAELLNFIKNCALTMRIRSFLGRKRQRKGLVIRITNRQTPNFQDRRPNGFSDNEVLLMSLLEELDLVETEIRADKVSIERFSSGEQSLIRLFSFFADLPIVNKPEKLIVFFDEPENSLHPKWQHQFPFYFKRIVEEVYQIKSSHFIIATHSPLIVMRTSGEKDMNVLRFYRDDQKRFASEAVVDIQRFSIEEVLLDEFLVAYRDRKREEEIIGLLDERYEKQDDPINAIPRSFELRKKIDDLYNSLRNKG